MKRPLLFAVLLLATLGVAGQRCGVTDTVPIAAVGESSITIDIDGYLNDDLGDPGQGLCEVSFFFRHSYVYDFTATLTSPSGQAVQLVGPVNNQTRPPTTLARWFTDFQRCDSTAAPDPGAPPTWDNNVAFDWPAFGLYQGDYFPASGCFEDLDAGPVNGTWTLTFDNARAGEQGVMTYLLLTFCDDANAEGPCCFADAGELETEPPPVFCEQLADLPFDFPPRYRRPRPDTAFYDYTYAIARNDSLLLTMDEVNLAGLPAGEYEICGLSYRRGELGALVLDGSLSPEELRADFAAVSPAFCGDLTSVCQRVRLAPIPDTTFLDEQVCIGGSYTVGSTTYTTTGRHVTVLPGFADCDSVVVLDLAVVDVLRVTEDTTICSEAVYVQQGNVYDSPGTYVDTLVSDLGCDSIVTLNLSIAAPLTGDTSVAICAGDTFFLGGRAFFEQANDFVLLTAANGCDSTVALSVIVLDPEVRFGPYHQQLTCDLPNTFLNASSSDLDFLQSARWLDTLGNTIRNGLGVTADTGGTYIFELTVGTLGATCAVRDTIILPDARFRPELDLALPQVQCTGTVQQCAVLNCRNPTLGVEVAVGPSGPDYDYNWTVPPGGSIDGLPDGPSVTITGPGRYDVLVEDPVTGCRRDTFLEVTLDRTEPVTNVSGNALLNCVRPEITLLADTFQTRRGELDFIWMGGCLTGPVAGPALTIDCPGSYTLSVSNRTNFCSRDTTIVVRQNLAAVDLDLAPAAAPLNCYAPQQTLTPQTSANPDDLEIVWTRNGSGNVVGNTFSLEVFAPGTYQVIGTDSVSRCADTTFVIIAGDTTRPVAVSDLEVVELNCYQPTTTLGSSLTSTGPTIEYAWVNLADPTDTLGRNVALPVSSGAGTYRLAVFDRENGCRSFDSTVVTVALDTPRIALDLPLDFDCFIDSVVVDASATLLNFDAEQSWLGPCLPFTTDTNRLAAECPGVYAYTVTNLDNGCSATDSVEVLLADNSVVAYLPDSAFLDCVTGQTRLDRRLGTDAPVVRWFRDGTPVELTGMRPFVTIPGEYTLVLGNFNESCLDTARTTVVADCPVFPVIVPPDSITCDVTSVVLDARPSVPAIGGGEITDWITPPGAVVLPGPEDRQLTVFTAGTYGFAIENTVSGDRDTFFVEVRRNTTPPLAEAGPRDTITCYDPVVVLDGRGSSQGPVYDYRWTNTSGDSLGNADTLPVGLAGGYLLEVTHRFTGCADIDNVFVLRDTDTPELAFSSGNIPCDTVDFALAVIPDAPGNYTFNWTGPTVLTQSNNDTVRIGGVGEYTVTVTDVDNGCPIAGTVTAEQLPCPPFPALRDTTLTCLTDTIYLQPTYRDPCGDCTFRWERNGVVVVGGDEETLPVYRSGEYRLIVTNEFGLRGEAVATVTDSRQLPDRDAGPDRVLTCAETSVTLGNPAPAPEFPFAYQWSRIDGSLIIGAVADTLNVMQGGFYRLRTTNTFSGCTVVDTVVVTYDTISPVSVAGPRRLLDCDNKRRTLDGIASSLGNRYVYRWASEFNDLCLEGLTTLNPIVRCGGRYTLTVTDTLNGCSARSFTDVLVDDELPNVIPLPDTTVNCANGEVLLVGREIGGRDREHRWEELLPGSDTVVAEVSAGVIAVDRTGSFRFSVRDTLNGCSNEFTVAVSADLDRPTVDAGLPDTFFCALDSLVLSGSGSTARGQTPRFAWASQTGFQINNENAARAVIFQPDRYYLTVTDPVNFCAVTDSVTIFRDVEAPVAFAGRDTTLTCSLRRVRLAGSGTTLSGQATYLWTTSDGSVVTGSQTLTPLIAGAGRYQLNITDPVNDCTGADIVRVTEDTVRPIADIALPLGDLLNCYRPELQLNAPPPTAAGGNQTYFWTGPASTLTDARQQTVDRSGSYQLTVTLLRNDCRDTATVELREDFTPPVNPVNPALPLTCVRDSVELLPRTDPGAVVFGFRWLDAGGAELGTGRTQTVGATGTFRLETQDLRNGCRDTSSTTVFADRTPPGVTLLPPDVLNCTRTTSLIDGTASSSGPGFTTSWQSPDNTATALDDPFQVLGRSPGFHVLTVTNVTNGCSTTDSVRLEQSAIAVDDFEIDVVQPGCSQDETGEVMVVGVSGGAPPFRYRLDNGLLTDRLFYDGLPLGTYAIDVVGSDGCDATRTFTIEPGEEEFLELRSDTIISLGDSVLLNFSTNVLYDSLLWTSSGPLPALIPDGALWVRPFVSQSYRLQLRTADGCFATDNVVIQVDETVNTYIPSAFSPNGDGTNEVLRPFVGPQVEEITGFRIHNRWGELVYDLATDPGRGTADFGWNGTLGGKPLNAQVFVWEIEVLLVDGTPLRRTGDVVLLR